MKKLLILCTIASVFVLPVAGCLGEIKTYTDSGQTINIGVNQVFIVALGSIPATDYGWYASYDETVIALVD